MARKKIVKLSDDEYDVLNTVRTLILKKGTEKLCPNINIEDTDLGTIVRIIANHAIKQLKEARVEPEDSDR